MNRWLVPAILAAAGCTDSAMPPVFADNVVVVAPAPDMPMAAAYLEIGNRSGDVVRITAVTSPQYESVEIHETTLEDGIARMREIPVLEIADGETVTFERGGKHLMLMRPDGVPDAVTLNFYADDVLLLSVSTEFTTAN